MIDIIVNMILKEARARTTLNFNKAIDLVLDDIFLHITYLVPDMAEYHLEQLHDIINTR